MTVAVDTIKYVVTGDIATSQTWSIGFWTEPGLGGTVTAADLLTACGTFDTGFSSMWSALAALNAATTRWTGVSAYYYPAGSAVATIVAHRPRSAVTGSGSQYTSPRSALVISLLTSRSGRSYRGRVYFPVTAKNSASNLQMDSTTVDSIASNAASLGTYCSTTSFGGSSIGSCPIRVLSHKLGIVSVVNSVRVDSKMDTQRRREDKLAAAYQKTIAF